MVLLVLKVLLAPLLLAACSLAAWRWGAAVGGWLLGLPLISGPVSFLLFLQHGTHFAEAAARGTLLGFLATGAFCVWYAALARRARWWLTLPLAYGACLAVAWGLSFIDLPVPLVAGVVVGVLVVVALLAPAPRSSGSCPKPEPRPLLAKMSAASLMVLALTGLAGALGPRIAGLLAPMPVLLAFMAAAAHRRSGAAAASGLLRGALAGCGGGAAFFAVVALELGSASPLVVYGSALLAGLIGAALTMALQRAETPAAVAARRRKVRRAVVHARRVARVRVGQLRVVRIRAMQLAHLSIHG